MRAIPGAVSLLPAMLVLALSGCTLPDGGLGNDTLANWRPTGAPDANLAAMLVNPQDLVRGRGDPGSEGFEAEDAVTRLRQGHVRKLPDTSLVDMPGAVGDSGGSSSSSNGGGGGGGGPPSAGPGGGMGGGQ